MLEIRSNDIRLNKKEFDIIQKINEIIINSFKDVSFKNNEIKVFFLEEEEYYNYLGHEKPFTNVVITDGFYDKTYQEIFIRLNAKSIIRTYIHEIGHFLDYNINSYLNGIKIGSAFTRKIYDDIEFEDRLLCDLKSMPAYKLISFAGGDSYVLSGDEVFARLFEVFIWERLERKYFTPDLYIKVPKLFFLLRSWLSQNLDSSFFYFIQKCHLHILKRSLDRRKSFDPYNKDRFSKYVLNFLI